MSNFRLKTPPFSGVYSHICGIRPKLRRCWKHTSTSACPVLRPYRKPPRPIKIAFISPTAPYNAHGMLQWKPQGMWHCKQLLHQRLQTVASLWVTIRVLPPCCSATMQKQKQISGCVGNAHIWQNYDYNETMYMLYSGIIIQARPVINVKTRTCDLVCESRRRRD